MTLDMNDEQLVTLGQLEAFTSAAHGLNFVGRTRKARYAWIERFLQRFWYFTARKKNRSIIKSYAMKMTGYSDAQMTRLIDIMRKTRHVAVIPSSKRHSFPARYTPEDVANLVITDNVHGRLAWKATTEILRREHDVFGKNAFCRLKGISVSHVYNL
jgi:hypothetical protein